MLNNLLAFVKKVARHHLSRTLFLAVLAISIVAPLKWYGLMALPVAWLFVGASLTLLTRKVLLPYVKLDVLVAKAEEDPKASAIVVVGILILMGILTYCSTLVMVAPFQTNGQVIQQTSPLIPEGEYNPEPAIDTVTISKSFFNLSSVAVSSSASKK